MIVNFLPKDRNLLLLVSVFVLLPIKLVIGQDGTTGGQANLKFEITPTELIVSCDDTDEFQHLKQASVDSLEGLLRVWVADVDSNQVPPVAGRTLWRDSKKLVFQPRYPFRRGLAYSVVLRWAGQEQKETIVLAADQSPPTRLERVFPTASILPENNLKFYLHFTAPMQKGEIYRFVQIRDAESKIPVELPFLELEQEFWSRDSTRLTLLLDPGRIKRGLKPREEVGPIFVPGQTYELVVNGRWPDHAGRPLGADLIKRFRAGPYDETQPNTKNWKVVTPNAGTKNPLIVRFTESLDHSMLQRVIRIQAPNGEFITGVISVGDSETKWQFTPANEWTTGKYNLIVDNTLEDLAGNSVGKLFDVDMFGKVDQVPDSGHSLLTIEIQ